MITARTAGRITKTYHPETWRAMITIIAIARMTGTSISVARKALPGSESVPLRVLDTGNGRTKVIAIIAIARMTGTSISVARKALPGSEWVTLRLLDTEKCRW